MRVVVLAGGFGTRLRPITLSRPKALLPIGGIPILTLLFEKGEFPSRPILVVNKRFASQFRVWLDGHPFEADLVIEAAEDEDHKIGSIGALMQVVRDRRIDDDVLVLGGDNVFGFSLSDLIQAYKGHPLVALFDAKDPHIVAGRYGVASVEGNRIASFVEKPRNPPSALASTACYIFPRECVALLREFRLDDRAYRDAPGFFVEWLLQAKRQPVDAFVFDSYWHDIGDRNSYLRANAELSGSDTWISADCTVVGSEVSNTIVLPGGCINSCILDGCVIGANCKLMQISLTETLVGDGATLKGST